MCLQHPFKYLKIKPVLPALMLDYTLLLCTPRDRQDQLAVPFGTILYPPAQDGSSMYSVTPFPAHLYLPPLYMVCVSATPCWNAPLQHPGSSRPGVVLVLSKTSRSCRKKSSFAVSYSGTRGTCLSQGGPANLCCIPEPFPWSPAVMNHLSYCLWPNTSMGNGFKFKKV